MPTEEILDLFFEKNQVRIAMINFCQTSSLDRSTVAKTAEFDILDNQRL